MIKHLTLLLSIGLAYSQLNYQFEKDIPYYDDVNNIRCELDIYYPKRLNSLEEISNKLDIFL